ncbi:heme/hemin ABC transporter substrate-binding protein [Cedecea davisae]|uniref:heme/hemin ABC transporter substrate-binding protein n=1 Tax=Cedecea davisae TaxID=158484 RepID=UPI00242E9E2F|nr:ABC transporter substrate-binding protein [Cedecea davisae]
MSKNIAALLLALAVSVSASASKRLVVAGGSLTELIFALGAGQHVVGVDETTAWPAETDKLPHIGAWMQLSSESILSLRPTTFITWQDAKPQIVFEQLRKLKLNVLTLPRIPATVDQMYANIQTLANALARPQQGEVLIANLRHRLDVIAKSSAQKSHPVRAMFILSAGGSLPQVAGAGSVADIILKMAGANNIARHRQYQSYSTEAMIAANPDVIVATTQMTQGDPNALKAIPGITLTSAWKNKRIVIIDQALILGMGPRIAEAVEQLHHQFWPEPGQDGELFFENMSDVNNET